MLQSDFTLPAPLPPMDTDWSKVAFPRLEFVFRLRIQFRERVKFQPSTPQGGRVYVPPVGGDIDGPRLKGRVVPYSGADYARGRADGAGELNAHYLLEADDGTPIYINNRGFLYGRDASGLPIPNQAQTQTTTGEGQTTKWAVHDDTYFFCIPAFDVPVGPHDWLTRHVILGRGRRQPPPAMDHTVFDYFLVDN